MSFKKRYRGHCCKVCGQIKSNEKFNGKGHKNHICKICSKIPAEQQAEMIIINNIYRLYKYSNLSRQNKQFIKKYLDDPRENIQKAATEIWKSFIINSFVPEKENDFEYEKILELENYLNEKYENNLVQKKIFSSEFDEIPF